MLIGKIHHEKYDQFTYLGLDFSELTTLLLPELPLSSPASSCRREAGPELAALGPEKATPKNTKNKETLFNSCRLSRHGRITKGNLTHRQYMDNL